MGYSALASLKNKIGPGAAAQISSHVEYNFNGGFHLHRISF